MKRKVITLILLSLIMVFTLTACSDSPIGFYRIKNITAGSVTMTEKDGKSLGMQLGSLKLQKSGKCKFVILNDESEGVWKESKGVLTVKCGDVKYTGKCKNNVVELDSSDATHYTLKR